MAEQPLLDPHAEAAIDWMVELGSGEMRPEQQRAFDLWLSADIANERAWIRLQEGLLPYGVASRSGFLNRTYAMRDLVQRKRKRRAVLALGVLAAGCAVLPAVDSVVPLGGILADRVTRTGEMESLDLADGSRLHLQPRTAVNLRIEHGLRKIELREGGAMAEIAPAPTPFFMTVSGQEMQAERGHVMVSAERDRTRITVVEGEATIRLRRGAERIGAGEELTISAGQVSRRLVDGATATAWIDGLLVAEDSPAGEVVAGLRPYFNGVIRIDPVLAGRRVTGVFSLRHPDSAIVALASTLEAPVHRVLGRWITIAAPVA